MKKILVLLGFVAFLAAACDNTNQSAYTPPPVHHTQSTDSAGTSAGAKVDAAVNNLSTSVDSEAAITTQSDDDVINSDKAVINSYDGVSNASTY